MKFTEIGAVSFFLPWVANYNVQGARMATDENLNLKNSKHNFLSGTVYF